ncbi:dicarboxylate/amino acid:cation symporter [Anaerotignum sp.]|uniref:dicarboxylate/amino acid:cation symporter n=1 Tax=Anaerotignum sp. TaxID=2039241 RepID=UPI002A9165C2|nr:dicarboxylate/amino acid:cation symporter [Anaerotignum sp.]MCI7658434.1 dicarboxylate/amino acid:cation symporter [Clostridia bacterium]MDY5414224.1 dicarboxylate/amino acid:cation symporter [Anaerotignum sp.]
MEKAKKKLSLGTKILIGIIIGLAVGFLSPELAETLSPLGSIFLRLLKMLMVPLVFFSITAGICKMGDVKRLATVGLRYIIFILIAAGITSTIGIIVAKAINLGSGTTEFLDEAAQVETVAYSFIDNMVAWIPENIVDAMATANMLQIIVFAIFLGVALLSLGDRVGIFIKFMDQGSEIMLKITEFVMAYSPIGIASLMATMVTTISGATMKEVIAFIAADYACGIVVLVILYPIVVKVFAKLAPMRFMKKISEPIIVAATTTSSAATLPVSIKTAGEKLGIPENIYGFTLPLGNTCGMSGFALFIGLLCVFASNLYGLNLSVGDVAQYIFLGIVLSVGAAGVKGAGVIMSTVLLETIGMPLSLIPILAAIWPAIDPCHTVLNNVGDLVGTSIIARQLGEMDMDVYEGKTE